MADSGQSQVNINVLSDLCLEHIFLYIEILERVKLREVCKKWRDISDNCWRKIQDLDLCGQSDDTGHVYDEGKKILVFSHNLKFRIGLLKRCGPYLETLTASECNLILPTAFRKCRKLKKLDLNVKSQRDDQNVKRLLHVNKHITSVSLHFFEREHYKCLEAVPTSKLEEIFIVHGSSETPEPGLLVTIKKMICNAPVLQDFACNLADNELLKLVSEKETLTHFSLDDLPLTAIGIEGLNYVFDMKNLKNLYLDLRADTPTGGINDHFITGISNNCQGLETILLAADLRITDDGVLALLNLPHLTQLDLSKACSITDTHLKYFVNLKCLAVCLCKNVHDPGIVELLHKSQVLQRLDVRGTSITSDIVTAANREVKTRTNQISLTLNVSRGIVAGELQHQSSLLKVYQSRFNESDNDSGHFVFW